MKLRAKAPRRKRPRRVARKLAARGGYQHHVWIWTLSRFLECLMPSIRDDTMSGLYRTILWPQMIGRTKRESGPLLPAPPIDF